LNELPQENSEIPVDGKLNFTTKKAVQDFQNNYNKAPQKQKIKDPKGNVDTATWKALWEKTKDNTTLQKKGTWETICNNAKPQ
jgi:predicted alpha/beta-fold hydrolase